MSHTTKYYPMLYLDANMNKSERRDLVLTCKESTSSQDVSMKGVASPFYIVQHPIPPHVIRGTHEFGSKFYDN